jgi:ParB-like chromosome segregation protein Spo0J
LGLKEVPVFIAEHLTPTEIMAARIADNKIAEEGEWDDEMLDIELQALKDQNFDLDLTGFEDDEFDEPPPKIKEKKTKRCPHCDGELA